MRKKNSQPISCYQLFCLVFFLFFSLSSVAQTPRQTSFDDRPSCEESRGVWRQFGNGCADDCRSKFDQFNICTRAASYGCDCGKNRCWNGEFCVALKDYEQVFLREQAEEKKLLDAAKEKRRVDFLANQQVILNKLNQSRGDQGNRNQAPPNPAPAPQNAITPVQAEVVPAQTAEQKQADAAKEAENSEPTPLFKKLFGGKDDDKKDAAKSDSTATNSSPDSSDKKSSNTAPSQADQGLPEIPLP